jgi:hypothetical protein
MGNTKLDTSEFWVIGDFVAQVFARWGGDIHGCYIDCADPARAERFDSYREARESCFHDVNILEWKKDQRDPKAVKPLRCRVQVAVYPSGARP